MPSARAIRILRSKTDLSDDDISSLSEAEAWEEIYAASPPKAPSDMRTRATISGFPKSEQAEKKKIVEAMGFRVMSGMAKSTEILIIGNDPGPVKLIEAKERNLSIYEWEEFLEEFSPNIIEQSEQEAPSSESEFADIAMVGFTDAEFSIVKRSLEEQMNLSRKICKATSVVLLGESSSHEDIYEAVDANLPVMSLPTLLLQASEKQEISVEFLEEHCFEISQADTAFRKIKEDDAARTKSLLMTMAHALGEEFAHPANEPGEINQSRNSTRSTQEQIAVWGSLAILALSGMVFLTIV